jgi:hypothetical protein
MKSVRCRRRGNTGVNVKQVGEDGKLVLLRTCARTQDNAHTEYTTRSHIYIYIYMCVCYIYNCVCVRVRVSLSRVRSKAG